MLLTRNRDLLRLFAGANPWHLNPVRFVRRLALLRARETTVYPAGLLASRPGPCNVLLVGPRGVGKTTALHQLAARRLTAGVPADWILYLPLAVPALADGDPAERVRAVWGAGNPGCKHRYLLIDDVHLAADWEATVARIAAAYAPVTVVAAGELAPDAAPEHPSPHFNVFAARPLSFTEYLRLSGRETGLVGPFAHAVSLPRLNRAFDDYLNHGGFPALWPDAARPPAPGGVAAQTALDIVDDGTPNMAGINDTRDLKRTFAYLVARTGEEVAYEPLSQDLGIAKNTLRKYIDYLEEVRLLVRLNRVDQYGKKMERTTRFKVYAASPALYAALTGAAVGSDVATQMLAETALLAHFGDTGDDDGGAETVYARWGNVGGENNDGPDMVPFVGLAGEPPRVRSARTLAWTTEGPSSGGGLRALVEFCHANRLDSAWVFDRASIADERYDGVRVTTRPLSWACYLASFYFDPDCSDRPGPYAVTPRLA